MLYGLFASVFVRSVKFKSRLKGTALLWGFLLSYAVARLAIIIPLSYLYQLMKMKSAKPKPVPTTSFEHDRSSLVDFVSNHTFNFRNRSFSC